MTITEIMSEWNHFPDSERGFLRDANARNLEDFLVSYRGEVNGVEDEDPYIQGVDEIYAFVSSLAPKHVAMAKDQYKAARRMLGKNLDYNNFRAGNKDLNEEAKIMIAYLVHGGQGVTLPDDVASNLKSFVGIVKREDEDKVKFEKLQKQNGLATEGNADIDAKESNMAAFNNPEEAEANAVELLGRLSEKMRNASKGTAEDSTLYPFYVFDSGEKYSDVPPPKVRAGDVIQVTTSKELRFFDFTIAKDTSVK